MLVRKKNGDTLSKDITTKYEKHISERTFQFENFKKTQNKRQKKILKL